MWNYKQPTVEGEYIVMTKTTIGGNLCHIARFSFDDKGRPRWSFKNQTFVCWTKKPLI